MIDAASRTAAITALAICACLLAVGSLTTLWDRDEPRFAQAAVEMIASGDYLVPTFNGEVRAQKPPLVYWLMTASLRVLGPREIAVRVWSPIGIALAAYATFIIGRRFWSARVGLAAMVILALTPMTIVQGTAATTDAVLLASITTALALFSRFLVQVPRWTDAWLLALALAVGLLVKGPVAIVLPIGIASRPSCSCGRPADGARLSSFSLASACSPPRYMRRGSFLPHAPPMA